MAPVPGLVLAGTASAGESLAPEEFLVYQLASGKGWSLGISVFKQLPKQFRCTVRLLTWDR